jgi:hypothetical protein
MIRPIGKTPIHMSIEEVAVHTGHKFLMESDDNTELLVVNPQGSYGQVLSPHPIQYLSCIIISLIIIIINIKSYC